MLSRILKSVSSKMSGNWIVYAGLSLLFIAVILLAAYAGRSVVTQDQWHFLDVISAYYQHGFSFRDVWEGHGPHRTPGYKALFLLDAIYFHLNVKLEIYAGILALLAMAVMIYSRYRESMHDSLSSLRLQLSFLVIATVIFSFNQWAVYLYSLTALDDVLGNMLFVWLWCYLDRGIRGSLSYEFILKFCLTFLVLLLIFGEGRGVAVILGTILAMLLSGFYSRAWTDRKYRTLLIATVLTSILSQLIYWKVPPKLQGTGHLFDAMLVVFTQPWGAMKYAVITLGSSLLNAVWEKLSNQADSAIYVVGIVVILAYLIAARLFFRNRMWQKTWLPMIFMFYSILFLGLLLVGRYGTGDISSAASPRYATDLQLGLVGILWVFYYTRYSSQPLAGKWIKSLVVVSTIFVLVMQAGSIYIEGRLAPYQRKANLNFVKYMVSSQPSTYFSNPESAFLCPNAAICVKGVNILRKYGLRPFNQGQPSIKNDSATTEQMNVSEVNNGRYDPRQVYDSQFMQNAMTPERSAAGVPGLTYWQNHANYMISAKLDPSKHLLTAKDIITYINNSPDKLSYLWLALEQNIYRTDSRGMLTTPYGNIRSNRVTDGIKLNDAYIEEGSKLEKARYFVDDTNMRIDLPRGLPAHGGKLRIIIDYSFDVSDVFYGKWDRMGWMSTPDGPVYAIAQWYPRMDVYDDVAGWNTLPYRHQGEFYLDYGSFEYSIDVPCGYIVTGSGVLTNPHAVLTDEEIDRLREASQSDATVHIRSTSDVGSSKDTSICRGQRVWKFEINNARDAVWAASPAFVWDAARVNLPKGKKALAMAFYPRFIANTSDGWSNTVQYLKKNIEFYSKTYFTYPYPNAIAVAAPVQGMEYPAIVFMSWADKGGQLFNVTTHEIGHTWFPIIVGSNERRYAWMDEGFDVFINHVAWDTYANNSESAGLRAAYTESVTKFLNQETLPIMTIADDIPEDQLVPLEYGKTALGLGLLRNYILNPEDFDHAFRDYIKAWAYRHPTPYDFFRLMNNETGENLDWFWKEWFFENWKLDQAVTDVRYVDNDPKKGSIITLMNNDKMVMPVVVAVHEYGGKTTIMKLPVEIWTGGDTWKFKVNTSSKIASVVIDPNNLLPDADRSNNTWIAGENGSSNGNIKNSNRKLGILKYGPKIIKTDIGFNVQSNGESALWILMNQDMEGKVYVFINGTQLSGVRRGNVVTVAVPTSLYSKPGNYPMYVLGVVGNETIKSNQVDFTVH